MRRPMGGMPGMVPGQMAFGHISALAGAPSMTGGILIIDASSLGNLKPASLKAFPKSFNWGKSIWHVLQLVWYMREKAGMACPGVELTTRMMNNHEIPENFARDVSCMLCATKDLLGEGHEQTLRQSFPPHADVNCRCKSRWAGVSAVPSPGSSDVRH